MNAAPYISPHLTTASVVTAAAVTLYLAAGEPFVGRRMYASLARRRDSEPAALVRYFRATLGFWAVLVALCGAVYALSPGLTAADLGLVAGDGPVAATGFTGALLAAVALGKRRMRAPAGDGKHVRGLDAVSAMLPRTRRERGYAVAVALVDAIGSELLYRGLLIAFGVGALGLHVYVAAALAVLVYAGAGLYQGRSGVRAFALFGGLCTALYLLTGSLLLPVAVHALLSLRDLVVLPGAVMKGRTA
ncbi:CPBP family glutamic-type intramembrane protease [Streptomyces sp. NPDC046939]|uniref:CPBP family glutamic-type intramembrane protease n=1 Tax=Streptomyces sp. NPDC046939 TaxID=3155376 RepID=UPI0033C4929E